MSVAVPYILICIFFFSSVVALYLFHCKSQNNESFQKKK